MKKYILYNPLSGKGNHLQTINELKVLYSVYEVESINVNEIKDYKNFFQGLKKEDEIILLGGDGTLNRFANETKNICFENEIYYLPVGNGNDFARDIGKIKDENPFLITKYLKNLPRVTVNDKTYIFINGVGYGIDGFCCEEGDKLKAKGEKNINYTKIAVSGLMGKFHPVKATVWVDGKQYRYKKVWLAPTMFGRYYGGGMMPTPEQNRESKDRFLSLMIFFGSGKLKTLAVFPSIFKGKHIKCKTCVSIMRGKKIRVEFDKPTPLQIDGETFLNVSSYTAFIN